MAATGSGRKAPPGEIPLARQANKSEVCSWFGISPPTLDMWIRRDCPVVKKGGGVGKPWLFDLLEVAKWRFTGTVEPQSADPEEMSPADRLTWYKGNRERDRYAEERGELMPFDLAAEIIQSSFTIIRAGLLGQHAEIAGKFPNLDKGVINAILDGNRNLLKRLSTARLPDAVESALDRIDGSARASEGADGEPIR